MKRGAAVQKGRRRAERGIISVATLVGLMLAPVPHAAADENEVRSGTIVTGGTHLSYFSGDRLNGCDIAPDCRVWLASGCEPALTGRPVGLTASIENVADLADGRSRWRVELGSRPGTGMAEIQLWRQDCSEIRGSRWRTHCLWQPSDDYCRSDTFRIPASARWMTVTGYPYIPWVSELTTEPLTLNWKLVGPVARRRH